MSSLLICLNLGFLVFGLFLFFFNTIAAINTNIYINLCSFLTKFGLYLDVFEMFHADLQILPLAILGASDTEALSRITNGFTALGLKQQNPLETVIQNHIDLSVCRGHFKVISGRRSLPVSFVPLQADVLSLRAVPVLPSLGKKLLCPPIKLLDTLKENIQLKLGSEVSGTQVQILILHNSSILTAFRCTACFEVSI